METTTTLALAYPPVENMKFSRVKLDNSADFGKFRFDSDQTVNLFFDVENFMVTCENFFVALKNFWQAIVAWRSWI